MEKTHETEAELVGYCRYRLGCCGGNYSHSAGGLARIAGSGHSCFTPAKVEPDGLRSCRASIRAARRRQVPSAGTPESTGFHTASTHINTDALRTLLKSAGVAARRAFRFVGR